MAFEAVEVALGPPAGPSSSNRNHPGALATAASAAASAAAPLGPHALAARRALLGGYLRGPRLLVLVGPQGAGDYMLITC